MFGVTVVNRIGSPPVAVDPIASKSRNLGRFDSNSPRIVVASASRRQHRDDTKRSPERQGLRSPKHLTDRIRRGIGRDIVVLGEFTQQRIANAATRQVSDETGVTKSGNDAVRLERFRTAQVPMCWIVDSRIRRRRDWER
jgi:hypothetical protein